MSNHADAHIHLFKGGYQESFASREGVQIDEVACYQTLMADHQVAAALVVGYAGASWCNDNNAHLADVVKQHQWVHPLAFIDLTQSLSLEQLNHLRQQGFVGLSIYVFDHEQEQALQTVPAECWQWLIDHHWLVSVNSKGQLWNAWQAVLDKFGDLRVLISHLGLPPRVDHASADMPGQIAEVTALGAYPGVCVKLSGFYAVTEPGHDYPHVAAWPYVESLNNAFSVNRLLWASDFSPCLDWLTFPQTIDLFAKMPFFSETDRQQILGNNLLALLDDIS
jgi:predicted TIM-barrel fold metal-dependent hydrolase